MSSVAPAMLRQPIRSTMAWRAAELRDEDWSFSLPAAVIDELRAVLARYARHPIPLPALDQAGMDLPASRVFAANVAAALRHGRGFVLIDGLPIDTLGRELSIVAYWLLSSLVARPVAQKLDGTMVYDVHDTGRKAEPGSGVRPDKTNIEQYFHNDNAYSPTPPEFVGLLCLQPALEGGTSGVASIHTIHNELLRRSPDLLARLYNDFRFDRQDSRAPHEPATMSAPIFEFGDGLHARLGLHPILNAYRLGGEPLDQRGEAAIALLKDVLKDETLCHTFTMRAGQFQLVNNRETCHRRTAFVDDPATPRHLVRLWLRDRGWRGYDA